MGEIRTVTVSGETTVTFTCRACGTTYTDSHRCGESSEESRLRSQLAAVTRERDEAREIIEGNAAMRAEFSQLSDSFVVEQNAHAQTARKLATAVEALDTYAGFNGSSGVVARQALAAIRAPKDKPNVPRAQECVCSEVIGRLGLDPKCPKHGAPKHGGK